MMNLINCLCLPNYLKYKIEQLSEKEEQQRNEYIHYFMKYSASAMWGWKYLAGKLQWYRETCAITAVKTYA